MLETIGHYKILERLGAGGIGEVFRARDTRLGRTVAIKVVSPEFVHEAARRERFRRDARLASTLSHPNIAALFEVGEDQGHHFLVFEYVPGERLKDTIGGRPLNPRRAVDYAIQLADALADAHAENIAHYDLKPDNIVITPKGNAKILDFGLAGWTSGGAARERTGRATASAAPIYGEVVGRTVPYMSPEQARGDEVDYRSDLFSLGVVLFEMLVGRPPFAGTTPAAVASQIAQTTAPAPSSLNRSVPPELDPIVQKLLEKSLEKRYESAATVAAELRSVAAIMDVRSGANEPRDIAAPRPKRRPPVGWILAIIAVAIAALIWLAIRM